MLTNGLRNKQSHTFFELKEPKNMDTECCKNELLAPEPIKLVFVVSWRVINKFAEKLAAYLHSSDTNSNGEARAMKNYAL